MVVKNWNDCRHLSASLLILLTTSQLINGQQTEIQFTLNTGEGLIYFLLVFFMAVNFATPVVRWIYIYYLQKWFERAGKEVSKMQKRISERMSDAGRKLTQSIRSE